MKYAIRATFLALLAAAGHLDAQEGSPAGPVPVDLLQARRSALAGQTGGNPVVLVSAEERSMDRDYPQDSDFRQDNDFFYLTGLETRSSILVLTSDGKATLYIPPRNPGEEIWTGVQPDFAQAARVSGISDVRAIETAARDLQRLSGTIRTKTNVLERGCIEGDACPAAILARIVAAGRLTTAPVEPLLAQMRVIKDGDELRRMRRAIEITTTATRAAMADAKPGAWEYEIEALIEYTFRRMGAERVGFPSIVGSGPNGTTLHYDKSRRQTRAGDLVVTDIGAEFGYYTADVTRTFPVSGRFTERQRKLYDLVLATQQVAIDSVRPGMTVGRLNGIARDYMKTHSGSLCGAETCDRHFPHGLSHFLGMDTHDVGDYSRPLEPGMIVTVEPGIYLPAEDIGIRIEDDILVTKNGRENLSSAAPRKAEEIEALMAGAHGTNGSTR